MIGNQYRGVIMAYVINRFKTDRVLFIALSAATLSFFISGYDHAVFQAIEWKVLIVMFSLMLAVAGIYETHFFDDVATRLVYRFDTVRMIALMIVIVTFLLSMFLTNDAVLLTLVPFSIFIMRHTGQMRHAVMVIVLQTVAANLGSALTPMGDPQNIYLFTYYDLELMPFMMATLPISLTGFIFLVLISLLTFPAESVTLDIVPPSVNYKRFFMYFLILINGLLIVLRILPEWIGFLVTMALGLAYGRHLFKHIDYPLLLTFAAIFIFTYNVSTSATVIRAMTHLLTTDVSVLMSGIAVSQLISNVPAAVLLSSFTDITHWKSLLQGVNIGAMGTIIASLASLISFKYIIHDMKTATKRYLLSYTLVSLAGIAIITLIVLVL